MIRLFRDMMRDTPGYTYINEKGQKVEAKEGYCNCHPETCCHFDGKVTYHRVIEEPKQLEGHAVEIARNKALQNAILGAKMSEPFCHADRDGDCTHPDCPQLKDNEPETTGRHCPWDRNPERYE